MTPQDKAIEADRRKKSDDAFGRAVERAKNSPDGMRDTAHGLRERALNVSDAGDRAAMLRIASEYERRAIELAERLRARSGG
jgi:hypothetical protein